MARNITHDLRVLNAEQAGDDLVIDLYGGPSNACGSVRFTFTSNDELEARLALVRSWCSDQRSVALVTDDAQIVLIDERRLDEQQAERPERSEA
jgi:hypothetical protein